MWLCMAMMVNSVNPSLGRAYTRELIVDLFSTENKPLYLHDSNRNCTNYIENLPHVWEKCDVDMVFIEHEYLCCI